MIFFLLYIVLCINVGFIFSQESWNTNAFDYTWNKISKRMVYRTPILFTPFEIKAGYFHYGGEDYLDNFPIMGGEIIQHPVLLDSTHSSYNGLVDIKDRRGLFIELDIVKTNFMLHIIPQNIIDIQFGLGYRMSHLLSQPSLPNDITYTSSNTQEQWYDYKFFPKIHDFNFNTTISWQLNKVIIPYFYHSLGFSKISLYKTEADQKYLYGNAISETFSMGLKKIVNNDNQYNKYNLYYGFELKSIRTTTIKLDDPHQFSPIIGFDMRGINFNITFGVIYGGRKTIGDKAFSMMLEDDFESAIPGFEKYIEKYPKYGRLKKARKMLSFCKSQLPHQNYRKGISKLRSGNIDDAIMLFNEAYTSADKDLKSDINFKKEEIAKEIIIYINTNFDDIAIKKCEELINLAEGTSLSVDNEVAILRGKLFFKKASLLHESNLLNDAIEYYKIALSYDNNLDRLIQDRLEILVNGILMNSQKYQANNEYVLAVESLYKAIEIMPSLSDRLLLTIREFENIIEELNDMKTQQVIEEILDDSQSKGNNNTKNLIIGMTKDRIIDIINMPDNIEFIHSSLNSYEIWFYNTLKYKLYIKDEKLYQIQTIEE